MKPEPRSSSSTNTADQRRGERREADGLLRVVVEGQELAGRVSNVSGGGVMFTTDAALEVTVELEEDGQLVTRTGRLLRIQRLNASEIAVAVEFDERVQGRA